MANRNLNALSRDPLNCVPYYWGPHYMGPIQRDPSYRDPFCQDPLFRDMVYRDPLSRNPFEMTPNSFTTDTYQRIGQQCLQQNLILQQQLLQNQNQALMSAYQLQNAHPPMDLSSQKSAQPLQQVETSVVDSSHFQMRINIKHLKTDKVDAHIMKGFVVFTAKYIKLPGRDSFICSFKLPDDVDSGKLSFTVNGNGFLDIKAPRKIYIPTSFKENIGVQNKIEEPQKAEECKILNVQQENSEQKVIGVQTKMVDPETAEECSIMKVLNKNSELEVDSKKANQEVLN